ncbi:uncharacterized protein MONOS_17111 [Monocercomonoides exilis]|uniref:uncharacterized protein n=1 Tax=Monocercomonoides exilis TaxID=2049356 RepID=UPI00355A204C|nr:hypothetical protein MONOS_17111 [Monocercomonoides exilis]
MLSLCACIIDTATHDEETGIFDRMLELSEACTYSAIILSMIMSGVGFSKVAASPAFMSVAKWKLSLLTFLTFFLVAINFVHLVFSILSFYNMSPISEKLLSATEYCSLNDDCSTLHWVWFAKATVFEVLPSAIYLIIFSIFSISSLLQFKESTPYKPVSLYSDTSLMSRRKHRIK